MRKRILKKSEVLREGYMKGLRKAQRIINEMMNNVNKLNDELIKAARDGDISRVKSLLDNGADINAKNKFGYTPLHAAVDYNNKEISEFLLKFGADVNAKNDDDETPLHFAAWDGDTAICKLLMNYGADPWVENSRGDTPLDWATGHGDTEICKILKQYGARK